MSRRGALCAGGQPGNRSKGACPSQLLCAEPGVDSLQKSSFPMITALTQKPASTSCSPARNHWAWAWLGYTAFLFIQPLMKPSRLVWTATILVVLVFVSIYVVYQRSSNERTRRWIIGLTFLLGVVTLPWNNGGSTFFIYVAAFLPFAVPTSRVLLACFAIESVTILTETAFLHRPSAWPNAIATVFLLVIIGGGNNFIAEQKRAQARLNAAQEENLALAALAERERIARDLHDVLGHTLSVIVLKAELSGRLLAVDPARATDEIADVERIARSALAEVREAIGGYRSRGLAAEIETARRTLDAAGVSLSLESDSSAAGSLSPQEETALSLALREAVTNIVRHAHASECRLRFVNEAGRRRLIVEDNGRHMASSEGNGLRGMRERIECLGGQFLIERHSAVELRESRAGGDAPGTRLVIDLPLRPAGETSV